MYLQIDKVIVWPKLSKYPPRIVQFELGKLNVITGNSRTGKSAVIPIVDYCLGSSECSIPIDTIRDHASWYGVVIQKDREKLLFARGVPEGNKVSNRYYVLRGSAEISIPPHINESNEDVDGVKNMLNAISGVPYFELDGKDSNQTYGARLGFRDLMALVFQNQDIVANQNILFYKTHAHAHRERLRNWFPYIIGAETIEVLKARQRLQELERKIALLKRDFERVKNHANSWKNNMLGHLKVADEYGLIATANYAEISSDEMIQIAKKLVLEIPDTAIFTENNLTESNKELKILEERDEEYCRRIAEVKKRLMDLKRLESGFVNYGEGIKKRADRLQISQWLMSISSESGKCIACGSVEHPSGNSELEMISKAFVEYETKARQVEDMPTSISREELRLEDELRKILEEKDENQKRYDFMLGKDNEAQKEFQKRKNMFVFLGHLKASLETFEKVTDGGEYVSQISEIENEIKRLKKIADYHGVKERVESATEVISNSILKHLGGLDVEKKYKHIAPKFSIEDLNISVLSSDGNWHYLAEVGSASNWVSYHLALFCSLQEYFISQSHSPVPGFVVFDQPSQVYFPKIKNMVEKNIETIKFEDDDIAAVKSMFTTISNSIIKASGQWQAIVLDHADSSVYGDIDGIHEVEIWRNGQKLIPEEWYEQTNTAI